MNLAAFATALLLAGAVSAPSVDQIVARYLETRGGVDRLRSVTSLRMTGTLSAGPGAKGLFRIEHKRPGKMRVEAEVQGRTLTQATDGRAAWVFAPTLGGGSAVILPKQEAADLQDQADFEGPLVDAAAKGHRVEFAGRETRFGGEAFRLRVRLKSGDVRTLYIDVESHRQVAEEGERETPRGRLLIETRFSDHRVVEGLLLPFVLDITAGTQERQRVTFETVELNVPIDDARFSPPASARVPPPPPR